MRLKSINSMKDVNKFLHSYYIPKHNRKFAVIAKDKADLHRQVSNSLDLDRIFSIKNKASLRNDFAIQYRNRFYQILETIRAKEVTIEECLNGKLHIYYKDAQLKYKLIAKRSQKQKKISRLTQKKVYIPHIDHPLKEPSFKRRYAHINRSSQKEKSSKKEKELLLT